MGKNSEFYQALRKIGNASGAAILARQLFPGSDWYTEGVLKLGAKKSLVTAKIQPSTDSEKSRTIESLKDFAEKKLEETPGGKIAFPGGEVALQEGANVGRKIKLNKNAQVPQWSDEKIKVVFYGEASKLARNSDSGDVRAAELLEKMVAAMRLPSDCVIQLLNDEQIPESGQALDELVTGLFHAKPTFVVSLGAVATNALLGRKEKLTRVHGQFFSLKIENDSDVCEMHLMPLFHPDYLLINPNMKRTAWLDLQKVMTELGISIS